MVASGDIQPVAKPSRDLGPFRQYVALVQLREEALREIVFPPFADEWNQAERSPDRLVIGVEEPVPRLKVFSDGRLELHDNLPSA